jgi:hypothetical protein
VTRSLVKKLLHSPTLRLRALDTRGDAQRHLESLRYLFGLADAQDGLAQVVPIDSTPAAVDTRPAQAPLCSRKATVVSPAS